MRHSSLSFTWIRVFKRPEVNSESTLFLIFMNNGRVFTSLDALTCTCQCPDQFQLLPRHWQAKRCWISPDIHKFNLLENNPNKTRNNKKFQIENKENGSVGL